MPKPESVKVPYYLLEHIAEMASLIDEQSAQLGQSEHFQPLINSLQDGLALALDNHAHHIYGHDDQSQPVLALPAPTTEAKTIEALL